MPPPPAVPADHRTSPTAQQQQTSGRPDRHIARLADRQHGVVGRRQLEALGLTPSMLAVRLDARRLIRLHRGVYAVGHRRLTRQGEWLAAVLAAGPGAVLSHHSAAALHGLRDERSRRVDVSTTAKRATTNWIELHGRRTLAAEDVTSRQRIPVTTVSRTLIDLAEVLGPRQLARAVNEADVLRALDLGAIDAVLERLRGRRGRGPAALRAALDAHAGPTLLRSELEHRFKELLASHSLPRPEHSKAGRWMPAGASNDSSSNSTAASTTRRRPAARTRARRARCGKLAGTSCATDGATSSERQPRPQPTSAAASRREDRTFTAAERQQTSGGGGAAVARHRSSSASRR
jgi:predicted transcriptional regulator of viral defense system